jgi:glycosyltransferase involved in cell wall biosynthesis
MRRLAFAPGPDRILSSIQVARLLIISYHFPPDGAVGGLRWFGFSKNLAKLGWEVDVVTASPNAAESPIPGVTVHVRTRAQTMNDRYNAMVARRRATRATTEAPQANVSGTPVVAAADVADKSVLARQAYSLRKMIGASLAFPDHGRGWVMRAASAARGLLAQREYSLVISSGPPHSAHLAGMLATIGGRVPHWTDMRDPWSAFVGDLPVNSTVKRRSLSIDALQRLVFRHTAHVVVNNEGFATALRKAEPDLRISVVPNGVDLDVLPQRGKERFDGWSVAHVGTLYAGRNVTSVLAAVRSLLDKRPEIASRFRLRLIGPMDPAHRNRFRADLAASGISESVEVKEWLPRAEALDVLNRSHLAIVLAQDQPFCVPAKLYESIGAAVPTLVVAEHGSATAGEAARIGAIVVEPNDVDGLRRVFEDVVAGRIAPSIQAASPISYEGVAPALDHLLRSEASTNDLAAGALTPEAQGER